MTREQLEALFDKQDFTETSGLYEDRETYIDLDNVKKYVFNELIPEVLRELEIKKETTGRFIDDKKVYFNKILKQKAKELGFII